MSAIERFAAGVDEAVELWAVKVIKKTSAAVGVDDAAAGAAETGRTTDIDAVDVAEATAGLAEKVMVVGPPALPGHSTNILFA